MLVERTAYARTGQPVEFAVTCSGGPDPDRHVDIPNWRLMTRRLTKASA